MIPIFYGKFPMYWEPEGGNCCLHLRNNCLALVFWQKDDERVPMICVQTERFQYSFLGKDFWNIYRSRESFPCFSKKNNIILEAIDPTKKRCTLILVRALFIYILSTIIYFVAWFFFVGVWTCQSDSDFYLNKDRIYWFGRRKGANWK